MANVSQDIGVFFSLEGNIKPIIAVAVIIITKKLKLNWLPMHLLRYTLGYKNIIQKENEKLKILLPIRFPIAISTDPLLIDA